MKNYTKKPVTIQAVQWNGTNLKELAKFMQTEEDGNWVQELDLESMPPYTLQGKHWIFDDSVLMIKTLEGLMMASKGDFIIRGIKGEYYPCKPDIFEMTYNAEQEEFRETRFVVKALESLLEEENILWQGRVERNEISPLSSPMDILEYIKIENKENLKGIPPVVSFTIQSDPISKVGINGVQVYDMIRYCYHLVKELNKKFRCEHNDKTLEHLEIAINWQELRTYDRQKRGVEGKNEI